MSKNILGLTCYDQDSAVALIINEDLVMVLKKKSFFFLKYSSAGLNP